MPNIQNPPGRVTGPSNAPRLAQAQSPAPGANQSINARAIVDRYCVTCHNNRLRTAGLELQSVDLDDVAASRDVIEKMVRKLSRRQMPPANAPALDHQARLDLVGLLTSRLDRAAATNPEPGRPLLHRLNRTEYANAVRDLLVLDVDAATLLPPDDSGYGFDNISDLLGISPILLERYLVAADKVADLALGDPAAPAGSETFRVRQDASQDRHIEGLPLGTVGGILVNTTVSADGEYLITPKLFRTNLGTMRGLEYTHQFEIAVDGQRVHLATFGGNDEVAASSDNPTLTGNSVDTRLQTRVVLTAGRHTITAAFLQRTHALNSRRLEPFIRSSSDTVDFAGVPHLDTFTISGPFNATGVSETASRRRILVCRPASEGDEVPCARRIMSSLARVAFRGNVTGADITRLMAFYADGRQNGNFEDGVRLALRRLLASPKFVFIAEHDPDRTSPGALFPIGDLELATRMALFLWSSIPDEELIQAAERGTLRTPAIFQRQVRRMLSDPRAAALVANFAGQWLYLRNLRGQQPNSNDFPDFDDNLRQSLRQEAELFFDSIRTEDRSVLDLMTADYTFVNERLARHYGIPGIYGSHFRRVRVPDETRRGLLGKGALLMVTSHVDRTSPVRRGKWILENVLGIVPPPPPADVPPLRPQEPNERPRTMREQMVEHRSNPVCANCHQLMDPIGLALENFDAVGAWRDTDQGNPIDSTGQLADGASVEGPSGLRAALMREPAMFVETFTERLMTYALRRGVASSDMPAVRGAVRHASQSQFKFSEIVIGIMTSTPFQMRKKPANRS